MKRPQQKSMDCCRGVIRHVAWRASRKRTFTLELKWTKIGNPSGRLSLVALFIWQLLVSLSRYSCGYYSVVVIVMMLGVSLSLRILSLCLIFLLVFQLHITYLSVYVVIWKSICKANGGTSAARVADKQSHSYLVSHVLVHYFLSGHTPSFLIIASPSQPHLEIKTSVPVGRNSSH